MSKTFKMSQEQNQLLAVLEDTANLLQKTQVNLKKCPKSRLTTGYIEARMKIINDYWNTFKTAHRDLVKITPKEQKGNLPYFLNEEFFIYEDLYNILHGDLKDMLLKLSASTSTESSLDTSSSNSTAQNNLVQLPKIQLPTFTGTYEAWPAFSDLFISLVHNNTNLSDVQKLHYLKTSVAAEAESLLKHIQVTSNNYTYAWDILKTRYGNKRLILNSILKRLFNQRKLTMQSAVLLKGLLDTTVECLNNLSNMNISTDSWDPVIIHLLVQKLDPDTHRSWEEYAYKEESEALPTWNEFKKFLESKFRTLELMTNSTAQHSTHQAKPGINQRSFHISTPSTSRTCIICNDNHTLCHCKEFTKMEPTERRQYVISKRLCFNCLVPGHEASKCKLPLSCKICHRRHHSLLHVSKNLEPAASSSKSQIQPLVSQHVVEKQEDIQINSMIASHLTTRHGVALLATAVVEARSTQGYTIPLRALIDQGSQATFISEKATQLLKLERRPTKANVIGVGSTRTEIKHVVQFELGSQWDHNFRLPIQAYVMSKQLTTKLPAKTIIKQPWPHLKGLNLADPSYFMPGSIDLLLGIKEYTEIIQQQYIKGPPGTPCAQKTSLGWILFGDICSQPQENTYTVMHHQIDVEDMLKSIWEVEVDSTRQLTKDEKLCEKIYEETTTRNKEGRYIVKLPFKTNEPLSPEGNSKEIATRRFLLLEKRFRKSPDLKKEYTRVIKDYIEQNHIEIIPERERNIKKSVYLPHHAVVRNDKETSKTRVVFDASCKGNNNISLNDELLVGPQLQEDLRNLLMRWRTKQVGFVADIQQMYRQILVTKNDADYQRILWRQNEYDDIHEYRLLRVTFGTAPAPYLAVKTLQQVAKDEGNLCPLAAQVIKEDFYIDDLLSGADSTEEAVTIANEISDILEKGGFQLKKWSSNNIKFIQSIEESKRSANLKIDLNLDGTIKALGIVWNLNHDSFQYNVNLPPIGSHISKRVILSDIQKLFDPLGWLAPSTVMSKILIQKLWLEKINWDEKVTETLEEEWKQIRTDFKNVNEIQIRRWLGTTKANKESIQIHGFCDASMRAYAAAVYIRILTQNRGIETKLLAARTRVAPLKTISLPRLELCGALLLSKLMKQIGQAIKLPTSEMYAWTDSSIVISWLCGEPNRWKPFVANRVVQIIENINNKHWYHVQSKDNPADLASRGIFLSALKESDLWWRGPRWLSEKEFKISKPVIINTDLEMKTNKINTYLTVEPEKQEKSLISQFENFDNLLQLTTAIAFCKIFLNYKKQNYTKIITTQVSEESLKICIKKVQEEDFKEEIERLKENKQVKSKSLLKSLTPYLDEFYILRVGGRLRHSHLPNDRKNPIILGSTNILTAFIIADAHAKTLHGGIQLMLSYLRSKYWIIRAKSLVKQYIHKCLICAKIKAKAKAQIMGDLPEQRVTPSRPFLYSGVDFAGPFQTLMCKGRGNKTVKTYVAIFICMATKAIHIELVGDLTSEAFIGAFRRFVARRGKCSHLWSDQGRNFVGANKQLVEAWNEAKLQYKGRIAQTLACDGTQMHFIPAYSPNFGGLWEAGVKSIKYHLQRIVTTHLTYEEMTTVLCQVEACLNSRPLCPLDNSDPECLDPLTPGHFLIGEAPIVIPSPDLRKVKTSHLSRWQHTQKLVNDFWRRWQDEYLSRLQQRPKWMKTEKELQIGDIVLIKTDNLPPGKWSLGRITNKHPGLDGFTRVYSVKSDGTIIKRSISKLCALPIDSS